MFYHQEWRGRLHSGIARKRKYPVRLSPGQLEAVHRIIADPPSERAQVRAEILLHAHNDLLDVQIRHLTGAAISTIHRTRQRFTERGLDAALTAPRRRKEPRYCSIPGCGRYALRGRNVCHSHRTLDPDEQRTEEIDLPSLSYCRTLAALVFAQALADIDRQGPHTADAYEFLRDPVALEFLDAALSLSSRDVLHAIHLAEAGEINPSFLLYRSTSPRQPQFERARQHYGRLPWGTRTEGLV